MRIAIDLNDVIRDFSFNFLKYYCEGYDREFNPDGFEFWTNDFKVLFPWKNDNDFYKFIYERYVFEIFGKSELISRGLLGKLNMWVEETTNIDFDEGVEIMFTSFGEYGESIGYTLFFISKLATNVREFYFPKNVADIWEKCDVLITANPDALNCKPDNKTTIRIDTEYNKECSADYTYKTLSKFLEDINNTEKLIK